MKRKSRSLTANNLLHGAVYAMEQAGRLLYDADLLYQNGRYSSAMGLAVLSFEEIGRAKIYLDNRKRALAGDQFLFASVLEQCADHQGKIQRAMTGTIIRLDRKQTHKLKSLFADLDTEEYRAFRKVLDAAHRQRGRRQPGEMHRQRLKAFYVEPSSIGNEWNRPCRVSAGDAWQLLSQVACEYAEQWHELWTDNAIAELAVRLRDSGELPYPIFPVLPSNTPDTDNEQEQAPSLD